ncbi:hypothetical protein SGFS_066070 [Streptomyces graminofaciens]|uniref:Uncharacterized protein n=1 Tax=Streptomyces graminofaciens TaxID=68212 RepID=A0ABN5VQ93_9ACTN|nr:hypothetical protein SGFS_066070 [Streptomyces graminofaciens]
MRAPRGDLTGPEPLEAALRHHAKPTRHITLARSAKPTGHITLARHAKPTGHIAPAGRTTLARRTTLIRRAPLTGDTPLTAPRIRVRPVPGHVPPLAPASFRCATMRGPLRLRNTPSPPQQPDSDRKFRTFPHLHPASVQEADGVTNSA